MPRVAVTSRLFAALPEVKAELLAQYPDAKIADRFMRSEDEIIEFLTGHEIAVIGVEKYSKRVLDALPDLKILACCSAGVDHLDPALMHERGIRMGWVPGVNKHAVSELAMCLMLDLMRHANWANVQMREGNWEAPARGSLLRGRTVGVHGVGNIGKETVKLLQPFGVHILGCDREDYAEFFEQYGVTAVSPEQLWAESEVISLHLPRSSTTIGMYSADVMDKLRPGMFLVNTARGSIVDEAALLRKLNDGSITGAGFDVFHEEPVNNPELTNHPNVNALPHMGASARESWVAMARSGMRGITDNFVPAPGVYPFD